MECAFPVSVIAQKTLCKIFKNLLPPGKYRIQVKPLQRGQTLIAMIGYVTKDQRKSYYRILNHNVSAHDLTNGRRDHESFRASLTETRKILNWKNIFHEGYTI